MNTPMVVGQFKQSLIKLARESVVAGDLVVITVTDIDTDDEFNSVVSMIVETGDDVANVTVKFGFFNTEQPVVIVSQGDSEHIL